MNFIEKLFIPGNKQEKNFNVYGRQIVNISNNKNSELAKLGYVYRCIKLRADSFAKYQQKVFINDEYQDQHPIYDILENNTFANWNELKKIYLKWLDINGNSYIWFNQISNAEYNVWCLPAKFVTINIGGSNSKLIENYEVISYLSRPLSPDEILHGRTIVPNSMDFYKNLVVGTPELLNAALDYLELSKESLDYFERKMLRDNTVPYVLKTNEVGDGRTKLKDAYNSAVPNAYKAVAVLGEDDNIMPLIEDKKDSINFGMNDINKSIVTIMGVPGPLLTGEFANRNTADLLEYKFEIAEIYPLVEQFNNDLTRLFKRIFNDDRIKIVSDEPIYNDYEYYLKEMEFDIKYGIKSRNEIRIERDMDAIPEGDKYLIQSNLVYADSLNTSPVNEGFSFKNMSSEIVKSYLWKKIDDSKLKYEEIIRVETSKTFKALGEEIQSEIQKAYKRKIDRGVDLFDVDKWTNILKNNTKSGFKELIETIIKNQLSDMNLPTSLTSYQQSIVELTKQSTDLIGGSVKTIDENIKDEIVKVIEENPNVSQSELKRKLTEKTSYLFNEVYTKSRSELIAETTTTFSTTASQKTVFNEEGYNYTWLCSRDGKERTSHRKVDGLNPDKDGYFYVGNDKMKHPAGGSEVKENARCRCYLMPGTKI